ncbi:hypothetical protein GJ496_005475 [Pomphorhynchus laevis]|nr:hypothetical protein GJ496_005475 [Pomphorhynchus laevis]
MNNYAQLHCLSDNEDLPCFLLEIAGLKILIDFPLPLQHLYQLLPLPIAPSDYFEDLPSKGLYFKVAKDFDLLDVHPQFTTFDCGLFEIEQVDFILISNAHSFLGVPFLLKTYPSLKFGRKILCTEASLQLGRLLAEEIIRVTECLDDVGYEFDWYLHFKATHPIQTWSKFYSKSDLNLAVDQSRTVSFGEVIQLNEYVDAYVLSSSYSIGSCNWLLQLGRSPFHYKLAYISRSSSLSTHTKPLQFDPFMECDHVVLTQLTRHTAGDPNYVIGGFCDTVMNLLSKDFNVLVPCHGTGIIYDLFECLSVNLAKSGLKNVSVLFVSPISDQTLAFSNIFCEYLSNTKMERTLLPDYPFGHNEMIRNDQLKSFTSIYSQQKHVDPSQVSDFGKCFRHSRQVIFAGHPSLRFGEIVHFMDLYKDSDKAAVVFVEPDYSRSADIQRILAPYQPLSMKTFVYPLDTSLNFDQAKLLLQRKVKPGIVITSDKYIDAGITTQTSQYQVHSYSKYETINLPIVTPTVPRYPIKLELSTSLTDQIQLKKIPDSFWICGRFAAIRSSQITGRYQPSVECGGLIHFIAEMPSSASMFFFFQRQYPCLSIDSVNSLTLGSISQALCSNNVDVLCQTDGENIIRLSSDDKIHFDSNNLTINVECNSVQRRKAIKSALQILYKPLFPL